MADNVDRNPVPERHGEQPEGIEQDQPPATAVPAAVDEATEPVRVPYDMTLRQAETWIVLRNAKDVASADIEASRDPYVALEKPTNRVGTWDKDGERVEEEEQERGEGLKGNGWVEVEKYAKPGMTSLGLELWRKFAIQEDGIERPTLEQARQQLETAWREDDDVVVEGVREGETEVRQISRSERVRLRLIDDPKDDRITIAAPRPGERASRYVSVRLSSAPLLRRWPPFGKPLSPEAPSQSALVETKIVRQRPKAAP
jgi:hypothetical protein